MIFLSIRKNEYNREQIVWEEVPFSDNQACIDLIAAKPHGILRILDDQSGFPQVSFLLNVYIDVLVSIYLFITISLHFN